MEKEESESPEINEVNWYELFGKNVSEVCTTVGVDSKFLEKFEYSDSIYLKDIKNGYELWFNKTPDEELSHVTLYNENVDGYHKYNQSLPYGVDFDKCNNTDVIRRFGDTSVKSGGSMNVFCCCILLVKLINYFYKL